MTKPIIVAHRGIHHEYVENSLEALLAAWSAGVEWCECDVRGSAEHEPFLLHDSTLERTTAGTGEIRQTSAEMLGKWGVPSLEAVLEAMPTGAKLLIEIKPGVDMEVVARTVKLARKGDCIVQSFDRGILHQAASLRPEIPLALLVDDAQVACSERGPWKAVNAQFKSLNPAVVAALHGAGMLVGAWTVNIDADIRHILGLGVDAIISDHPVLVRDIASEIG